MNFCFLLLHVFIFGFTSFSPPLAAASDQCIVDNVVSGDTLTTTLITTQPYTQYVSELKNLSSPAVKQLLHIGNTEISPSNWYTLSRLSSDSNGLYLGNERVSNDKDYSYIELHQQPSVSAPEVADSVRLFLSSNNELSMLKTGDTYPTSLELLEGCGGSSCNCNKAYARLQLYLDVNNTEVTSNFMSADDVLLSSYDMPREVPLMYNEGSGTKYDEIRNLINDHFTNTYVITSDMNQIVVFSSGDMYQFEQHFYTQSRTRTMRLSGDGSTLVAVIPSGGHTTFRLLDFTDTEVTQFVHPMGDHYFDVYQSVDILALNQDATVWSTAYSGFNEVWIHHVDRHDSNDFNTKFNSPFARIVANTQHHIGMGLQMSTDGSRVIFCGHTNEGDTLKFFGANVGSSGTQYENDLSSLELPVPFTHNGHIDTSCNDDCTVVVVNYFPNGSPDHPGPYENRVFVLVDTSGDNQGWVLAQTIHDVDFEHVEGGGAGMGPGPGMDDTHSFVTHRAYVSRDGYFIVLVDGHTMLWSSKHKIYFRDFNANDTHWSPSSQGLVHFGPEAERIGGYFGSDPHSFHVFVNSNNPLGMSRVGIQFDESLLPHEGQNSDSEPHYTIETSSPNYTMISFPSETTFINSFTSNEYSSVRYLGHSPRVVNVNVRVSVSVPTNADVKLMIHRNGHPTPIYTTKTMDAGKRVGLMLCDLMYLDPHDLIQIGISSNSEYVSVFDLVLNVV
jgi:hypothetical protein